MNRFIKNIKKTKKNSNLPNKSLTPANVITSDATNRSAIANDARNKFPMRRRLRSV